MSQSKREITCIKLSKETKSRLDQLGNKQDTYEDLVKRLLDKDEV